MQCPDRNQDDVIRMLHELVLQNCNDTVLQLFLSETWLAAVLDSGASRTVSEKIWFEQYINSSPSEQQAQTAHSNNSKPFWFRVGWQWQLLKSAITPATTESHQTEIDTDIIDSNIPVPL